MYRIYEDHPISDRCLSYMAKGENGPETIAIADAILTDYDQQGYRLTLRQLYYQFVARGLLVENSERAYKNLGSLMTKARDSGLIDWDAIEDRGRDFSSYRFEEDEREVLNGIQYGISVDHWAEQDHYFEVWVEKDALINVVQRACSRFELPFMATRGYLSSSEAQRAGQRFEDARIRGKELHLIHLADHDPEGQDMTRDNRARLFKYSDGHDIEVDRIALNMDQVEQYNPPANYAKASSSRFDGYVSRYGTTCWELDALEPTVLVKLIHDHVKPFIDAERWNECSQRERDMRTRLAKLYDNWPEIADWLDAKFGDDYEDEDDA